MQISIYVECCDAISLCVVYTLYAIINLQIKIVEKSKLKNSNTKGFGTEQISVKIENYSNDSKHEKQPHILHMLMRYEK